MTWLAEQATAAADLLSQAGAKVVKDVSDFAGDVASTLGAAWTGLPPEQPGPFFEVAAGIAESIARYLPERVKKAAGITKEDPIAGYVTLPDGRKIPVPKYQDPEAQGEKALSSAVTAALRKAELQASTQRARLALERQQAEATRDQFERTFALRQRAAEQEHSLRDLQIRAAELALERETASPAQRALWGRPSTLRPETALTARRIKAIGPGVPGGIITTTAPFTTE